MESPTQTAASPSSSSVVTPTVKEGNRVDVPREHDVLCGRGGSINSHIGNEHFRTLVEKRKRVYLTARFKREKRLIASSIVSEIRALDGRFLTRKGGKEHGHWYDIGDEKARDKTSQALRENAPTIRAEIETEINQQRREMKRKEDETTTQRPPNTSSSPSKYPSPPVPGAPPGAPPPHPHYQSYWEYYYHYYGGYPPPPPPPPHYHGTTSSPTSSHPPHHAAAAAAGYPSPPAHWGQHPVEEHKEAEEDVRSRSNSQEEEDHRMAMALQHEENEEAYDARKRPHERSGHSHSTARSSAFVTPGSHPPTHLHSAKHAKHDMISPFESSRVRNHQDSKMTDHLTQEEKDHRLAVQLQEQDDNHVTHRREATDDNSRRTSRSNAYSQVHRVSRDAFMPYPDANSRTLEQMVGFAFSNSTKEPPQNDNKKSVQFNDSSIGSFSSTTILPLPREQMVYSPINSQRENPVVSSSTGHHQIQETSNPEDQNSSLLSQVASHILGTMGSWDVGNSVACAPDSSDGHPTGFRPRTTSSSARQKTPNAMMDTEGQEVQLEDDVRQDESTVMPPPEPRAQIDWPSRAGSCHSWIIPETIGAGAASFFGTSGGSHNRHTFGISPVNSLEMDGSHTEHLSCAGSVGGGSLCQIFNGEEDAYMKMALREVPSWERSMRSKSPLSINSLDDDDSSYRIPNNKPPKHLSPIQDNETNEPEAMDMDWD